MSIPHKYFFRISSTDKQESLPEKFLPAGWELREINAGLEHQDFYDTFEWQALKKGLVITRKRNALFLFDSRTGMARASMMSSLKRSFFFSGELPSSRVRDELLMCSEIRAYIKLCTFSTDFRTSHILDGNGNISGILTVESFSLSGTHGGDPGLQFISIQPFRGYEKQGEQLEASFSVFAEQVEPIDFRSLFLELMSSAGLNPGGYSSSLRLQLDPDDSIYGSAREALMFTLSVMRQNEPGIRKNIDTEFLHDYRVAVRRTRSILKQLEGVFEPGERAVYLNAFRDIGKRTNKLRDCDVILLKKSRYVSFLPPVLRQPLGGFFEEISSDRTRLQKEFSKYLVSREYRSFLLDWEQYISRPFPADPDRAPHASFSTIAVAMKSIRKAWKKVIRKGRHIGNEYRNTDVHDLRISCKKLRYLLEFFSSLFSHTLTRTLIVRLKMLQDNLGNLVDCSVQLRYLEGHLASSSGGNEQIVQAAAIGALMAVLNQQYEKARREFHSTFIEFDNHETEQLFQKLLTSPE